MEITPTNIAKEFKAGFQNGFKYPSDYSKREVIAKYDKSWDRPLVSAYWSGILHGMSEHDNVRKIKIKTNA